VKLIYVLTKYLKESLLLHHSLLAFPFLEQFQQGCFLLSYTYTKYTYRIHPPSTFLFTLPPHWDQPPRQDLFYLPDLQFLSVH
jgi:hypothetical protein